MAINLSRAWTGSTIAPQSIASTPAQTIAPGVNSGQFFNSLLGAMFGRPGSGGGSGQSAPGMSPSQQQAIDLAIQQIGAENWNRARQSDIRNFFSPTPAGAGNLPGISPTITPLGGGNLPIVNPLIEQSLSNARLAPSISLGTAASAFGSGGYGLPSAPRNIAPMSGWISPGFGF